MMFQHLSTKILLVSVIMLGTAIYLNRSRLIQEVDHVVKLLVEKTKHFSENWNKDSPESDVYNLVSLQSDKLFTKEELSTYHGEDSHGLYLAIMGRVYDVSKGERFYGAGKGYGFFRAMDGTKAFVTGQFDETGLVDNLDGLTLGQMIELEDWIKFYDKNYIYKGKVVGNFYDKDGNPTLALHDAVKRIKEAHIQKQNKEEERKKFPPCNSSWKQGAGKRLWCSNKSGGIERDWIGVPREMFTPGNDQRRCVCVRTTGPPPDDPESKKNRGDLDNPNLREYSGCDPEADQCYFNS